MTGCGPGLSLIVAAALWTAAPPEGTGASTPWEERLEALDPAAPMAYFELAEEVADEAEGDAERGLARHLFALAGSLDTHRLGRSVCLALADLETDELAKRRLLALGSLLDERVGRSGHEQIGGAPPYEPAAALAVAEALASYRKGNGSRALTLLRTPGAMDVLDAYGTIFRGGSTRFVEDCQLYRSNRKPPVSEMDLLRMLRFEAALLAGDNRTWSGELLIGGGRPLIEVDPNRLEESLGVDATRPCYRKGTWVRCD